MLVTLDYFMFGLFLFTIGRYDRYCHNKIQYCNIKRLKSLSLHTYNLKEVNVKEYSLLMRLIRAAKISRFRIEFTVIART